MPGNDARRATRAVRDGAIEITTMRRSHLRGVLQIEEEAFPRPWSATLFLSELALRTSRSYHVARIGPNVVGYCGVMFGDGEAHITTIAVDPRWQKHGIGTRLMLNAVQVARRAGMRHMTLEVRVSNEEAQSLYRRFEFQPVGVRPNYYSEVNEDALVMWVHDIDSEEYGSRIASIAGRIRSLDTSSADPLGSQTPQQGDSA